MHCFTHWKSFSSTLQLSPLRAACATLVTAAFWMPGPAKAAAWQVPTPPGYNHSQMPGMGAEQPNPLSGSNAQKLEHMREDDRHKRLESDTDKLVQLSAELKSEFEKTSKHELSLDVVRKAAEIEKLAHDVKERMKD